MYMHVHINYKLKGQIKSHYLIYFILFLCLSINIKLLIIVLKKRCRSFLIQLF